MPRTPGDKAPTGTLGAPAFALSAAATELKSPGAPRPRVERDVGSAREDMCEATVGARVHGGLERGALDAPPDLLPFRVAPSILAPPPMRGPAEPAPALDPAIFSAEIVESMRLGRFGRDGHALTMRLRAGRSVIEVDLRSGDAGLTLRLRGDDDAEIARLRTRVSADLAARGIEITSEDDA